MAIHSFLLLCLLPLAFAVPRIQQEPAYFPWSFAPAEANYQPFPVNYGQKAPASDFFLLDLNRGDLASGNFDIPRMPSRRPQPPSGIVPRSDRLADLPSFGDAAFQKHQPEFMAEPGVRPKFTGSFKTQPVQPQIPSDGPITNPAAYFLQGGNFEKVAPSKCHLKGCAGPVTNDANFVMAPGQNGACTQTFIPLNGCTDGKGYPMGMVCTICCDCMNSFVREMKKTRGFKQGFTSD